MDSPDIINNYYILLLVGIAAIGFHAYGLFSQRVVDPARSHLHTDLNLLPVISIAGKKDFSKGYLLYLLTFEAIYIVLASSTTLLSFVLNLANREDTVGALSSQMEPNAAIPVLASTALILLSQIKPFARFENYIRDVAHGVSGVPTNARDVKDNIASALTRHLRHLDDVDTTRLDGDKYALLSDCRDKAQRLSQTLIEDGVDPTRARTFYRTYCNVLYLHEVTLGYAGITEWHREETLDVVEMFRSIDYEIDAMDALIRDYVSRAPMQESVAAAGMREGGVLLGEGLPASARSAPADQAPSVDLAQPAAEGFAADLPDEIDRGDAGKGQSEPHGDKQSASHSDADVGNTTGHRRDQLDDERGDTVPGVSDAVQSADMAGRIPVGEKAADGRTVETLRHGKRWNSVSEQCIKLEQRLLLLLALLFINRPDAELDGNQLLQEIMQSSVRRREHRLSNVVVSSVIAGLMLSLLVLPLYKLGVDSARTWLRESPYENKLPYALPDASSSRALPLGEVLRHGMSPAELSRANAQWRSAANEIGHRIRFWGYEVVKPTLIFLVAAGVSLAYRKRAAAERRWPVGLIPGDDPVPLTRFMTAGLYAYMATLATMFFYHFLVLVLIPAIRSQNDFLTFEGMEILSAAIPEILYTAMLSFLISYYVCDYTDFQRWKASATSALSSLNKRRIVSVAVLCGLVNWVVKASLGMVNSGWDVLDFFAVPFLCYGLFLSSFAWFLWHYEHDAGSVATDGRSRSRQYYNLITHLGSLFARRSGADAVAKTSSSLATKSSGRASRQPASSQRASGEKASEREVSIDKAGNDKAGNDKENLTA